MPPHSFTTAAPTRAHARRFQVHSFPVPFNQAETGGKAMKFTHRVVAVIGLLVCAAQVSAGVKNGHFENRGAGNVHWRTCATWAGDVFIPASGGNPCSYVKIGTPNCGAGREAWQDPICVAPGVGSWVTLKFQAIATASTGITVTFKLSTGASTTRKIPASSSTLWQTHAVSLPLPIIGPPPTAKVAYTVCGIQGTLAVDNVSVCVTQDNQTTLGPPSQTPCNCALACP